MFHQVELLPPTWSAGLARRDGAKPPRGLARGAGRREAPALHSENAPRAKRHLDNYGSEWSNIWPYSYLGVPEWIENAIGSILFMALAKKKPQRRVLGGY